MWPAKKSTGEMAPHEPEAGSFAVSGRNTTDGDYARDAEGKAISLGVVVTPVGEAGPEELRNGTLIPRGRVVRVVGVRRPGHARVVTAEFPLAADPESVRSITLKENTLLVVS